MRYLILYLLFEITGLGKVEETRVNDKAVSKVAYARLKDVNFGLLSLTVWFVGWGAASLVFFFAEGPALVISGASSAIALLIAISDRKELLGKIAASICIVNLVGISVYARNAMPVGLLLIALALILCMAFPILIAMRKLRKPPEA